MPVVTVEWLDGRTAEQKRQLSEALTKAFVEITKVTPEQVWIVFRDVKRSDWAMSGKLLGEPVATGARSGNRDSPRRRTRLP